MQSGVANGQRKHVCVSIPYTMFILLCQCSVGIPPAFLQRSFGVPSVFHRVVTPGVITRGVTPGVTFFTFFPLGDRTFLTLDWGWGGAEDQAFPFLSLARALSFSLPALSSCSTCRRDASS